MENFVIDLKNILYIIMTWRDKRMHIILIYASLRYFFTLIQLPTVGAKYSWFAVAKNISKTALQCIINVPVYVSNKVLD